MLQQPLQFIFFGSSDFSVIILDQLLKANYWPTLVITTPDMPAGRQQILTPTPVKSFALKNNLPILSPEKLNAQFIDLLHSTILPNQNIDLLIVASYGKIIPQSILDLPLSGCLNVHPSLLPKYRGASPIQTALLNNDKQTGVTIMLMDAQIDHGPILSQSNYALTGQENFPELHQQLANLGAQLLIKTIPDFLANKIKPQPQNNSLATFTKIIKKTNGEINWQNSATEIYNQWRAYYSWPGIYLTRKNLKNNLKISLLEIKLTDLKNNSANPGEFLVLNKKLYLVAGNQYLLEIIRLQPAGKKELTANDFINGYLK